MKSSAAPGPQIAGTLAALLIATLLLTVTASAAAPFAATSVTDLPVLQIGAGLSRSGRLRSLSAQVEQGLDLWVEDVNQRGGLLGHQVQLITLDDSSTPEGAVTAYTTLLRRGVQLLVSPYASGQTLAVRDALGDADYAMVSISSSPQIWDRPDPRIFGLYTPADHNMDPFLDLLDDHGIRRVALVYQDGEFPRQVAAGVRQQAAARGLELTLDRRYAPGTRDFQPLISAINATSPQAVIVGSYLEDAAAFTNAAHAEPLRTELLAFSGGPAVRAYGGVLRDIGAAQGVLSTVQWMRSVRMPGSFDFGFRYRERHGVYPGYDAAGGYAAGQVLEAALRLAGNSQPHAVRQQISSMKYRSILGHFRVNERGLQTAKQTYLVQWQDNHISLVYPPHLARWQVLYPLPWGR